MYVIGGNDGTNFLCSCEVYDPLTNKWTFIAPMHRPRAGVGAAVVDGNLYVAGMRVNCLMIFIISVKDKSVKICQIICR